MCTAPARSVTSPGVGPATRFPVCRLRRAAHTFASAAVSGRSSERSDKVDLYAPADCEEQPALIPERTNPAQLRQPALGPPVVGRRREQLLRFLAQDGARVCPQVLD